ncbi:MAG: LuxR C-terminal-related transcriptional regulator [Coriobacteriales bacterium]|nr:LuxR C-terminal-related transcriptional regulator [Coriobacteriales bacterium]
MVKSLYISKSTVSTHIQHIYQKIGVHGRQELLDFLDTYQQK